MICTMDYTRYKTDRTIHKNHTNNKDNTRNRMDRTSMDYHNRNSPPNLNHRNQIPVQIQNSNWNLHPQNSLRHNHHPENVAVAWHTHSHRAPLVGYQLPLQVFLQPHPNSQHRHRHGQPDSYLPDWDCNIYHQHKPWKVWHRNLII